jgi:hypothetical protein
MGMNKTTIKVALTALVAVAIAMRVPQLRALVAPPPKAV